MNLLDQIKSPEFFARVGFDLPAEAMRFVLLATPEFELFQKELKAGSATDADLESYVGDLMTTFRRAEKFKYETTLAFLSVALEHISTSFAQRFISDLSKLHVSEMPLSPRVARVCMQYRSKLPATQKKEFSVKPLGRLSMAAPQLGTPGCPPTSKDFRMAA